MDERLALETIADSLKVPASTLHDVEGCWVGFLGSDTVIRFRSTTALSPGWPPAVPADVSRQLAELARELPGMRLPTRLGAYKLLGALHEEDDQLNVTDELLLEERGSGVYVWFRSYAG